MIQKSKKNINVPETKDQEREARAQSQKEKLTPKGDISMLNVPWSNQS